MSSAADEQPTQEQPLAQLPRNARTAAKMTLREVQDATDGRVSNAYLSQIETGRILKPSAQVLHRLSEVLPVTYELLMEVAGYLKPGTGTVPAFENAELTTEEHQKLLEYLAFLRKQRK